MRCKPEANWTRREATRGVIVTPEEWETVRKINEAAKRRVEKHRKPARNLFPASRPVPGAKIRGHRDAPLQNAVLKLCNLPRVKIKETGSLEKWGIRTVKRKIRRNVFMASRMIIKAQADRKH